MRRYGAFRTRSSKVGDDGHFQQHSRALLTKRFHARRLERWPALAELSLRYRGDFVYLTTTSIIAGEAAPLFRLKY